MPNREKHAHCQKMVVIPSMNQQPHISICIANYNGMGFIDSCINSVITQTDKLQVEIIVHDDSSTDDSVCHIQKHYPNVRLIESENNVGFCTANNRMAKAAKGEYLLLLNNDAALLPNALATLYTVARHLKHPAILGIPQYDADDGELLDNGSLLDLFLNPIPNKEVKSSHVGMIMGACLWIPKTLWNELGGFPEWFESIGEDLYLCCRARLAGYAVKALGSSGYLHEVGASFGGGKIQSGRLSTTRTRRVLSERNKTFVMLICYPWILILALFPLHILLLYLEGILLSIIKKDFSLFKDIYAQLLPELYRKKKQILSARRDAQTQRRIGVKAWLSPFRVLPWKLEMDFPGVL